LATAQRALGITLQHRSPVASVSNQRTAVRTLGTSKTPWACHRAVPRVTLCPWLCLVSPGLSYKRNCWKCEFACFRIAHQSTCTSRTSGEKHKVPSLAVATKPASFPLQSILHRNPQLSRASSLGVELWGHEEPFAFTCRHMGRLCSYLC